MTAKRKTKFQKAYEAGVNDAITEILRKYAPLKTQIGFVYNYIVRQTVCQELNVEAEG